MSLDIYLYAMRETCVFECNVTHNLTKMADAAGIYKALWRPQEIGVTTAGELIPYLEHGLEQLQSDPEFFKTFNPPNEWGDYRYFVEQVQKYLDACRGYPDARISVNR